jgi:hypothetical protein
MSQTQEIREPGLGIEPVATKTISLGNTEKEIFAIGERFHKVFTKNTTPMALIAMLTSCLQSMVEDPRADEMERANAVYHCTILVDTLYLAHYTLNPLNVVAENVELIVEDTQHAA